MRIFLSVLGIIFCLNFPFMLSVSAEDDPILARAGDWKITLSEFNRVIRLYDRKKQEAINKNPEMKKTLLKRILKTKLIADRARAEGFTENYEMKKQLELITNDMISIQYLNKVVAKRAIVTDKDIEEYYKAHITEYKLPERVKARHILVKVKKEFTDEEKEAARRKIEGLLERVKKGEDFVELAKTYSDDPASARVGGDLGYFQRGRMVKPFEDVAFSLKPGEVSDIVETRFGYHIIKVEDRKPAETIPLEKVKKSIREKLQKEMRDAEISKFIQNLMKEKEAEIHLELLNQKVSNK